MATSPVTALPANETNNPKTEYTTDMKDMPYYPVLEITAPQTKAPKTTSGKFIKWLTEVLISVNIVDPYHWELVPELMTKKNTPYYFEIADTENCPIDPDYINLAISIISTLDNNKDGRLTLTETDINPYGEAIGGFIDAVNNLTNRKLSEDELKKLKWNFYNPILKATNVTEDKDISKLEVAATLFALDKMSATSGKIAAEDVVNMIKNYKNKGDISTKFKNLRNNFYDRLVDDFSEKTRYRRNNPAWDDLTY